MGISALNVIQNDIPDTCVMGIVLIGQLCFYGSGDNITDLSLDLLRRFLLQVGLECQRDAARHRLQPLPLTFQSNLEYTRSRKSEMDLLYVERLDFMD